MPNQLDPRVRQWYRHLDKGQRFYVTAVDADSDTVEVQHFDGDLEEFSFDEWRDLDIAPAGEPANSSGAMDTEARNSQGDITDTGEDDWDASYQEHHLRSPERRGNEEVSGNLEDFREGGMEERFLEDVPASQAARNRVGNLHRRRDGIHEEVFNDTWHAEYAEDASNGLWRVDLFRDETSQWRSDGFDALETARKAALDFIQGQA